MNAQNSVIVIVALILGGVLGVSLARTSNSPVHDMGSMTEEAPTPIASTTMSGGHTHTMLEVDQALPVPTVTLTAISDSKDGYNLHIETTNYTFTPESAGGVPVPNTGHAHLYVNDVKVARVYGEWYHLSSSVLTPGQNYVMVTLNANDHSDWALWGNHIGAVALITK
jgi:hypothetical protein